MLSYTGDDTIEEEEEEEEEEQHQHHNSNSNSNSTSAAPHPVSARAGSAGRLVGAGGRRSRELLSVGEAMAMVGLDALEEEG
jgi:hypothetical protein